MQTQNPKKIMSYTTYFLSNVYLFHYGQHSCLDKICSLTQQKECNNEVFAKSQTHILKSFNIKDNELCIGFVYTCKLVVIENTYKHLNIYLFSETFL